jgi:3-methyladenine DNA glycosylase Tag
MNSAELKKTYQKIESKAMAAKGGPEAMQKLLPKAKSARSLKAVADDRYLSEMAKCIFRAGFVWKIVEHKWPGFEEAFHEFDINWLLHQSPEAIEALASDDRIIRNFSKVKAVVDNALFVRDVAEEHGSFGAYLAAWPADDVTGLWLDLRKRGSRLGGATSAYFLRFVGRDTFVLSEDVVLALQQYDLCRETKFTSQKALRSVQAVFNDLHEISGRPYCEISRILSYSV